MKRSSAMLATCLFLLTCGCSTSDGPKRFSVSGKVTYKGEPVPYGQIYFEPDGSKGNKGPQAVAEIKEGKYETQAGKGVVGGPHIVRIDGFDGKQPPGEEGKMFVHGMPMFKTYSTKVELPMEDTQKNFQIP